MISSTSDLDLCMIDFDLLSLNDCLMVSDTFVMFDLWGEEHFIQKNYEMKILSFTHSVGEKYLYCTYLFNVSAFSPGPLMSIGLINADFLLSLFTSSLWNLHFNSCKADDSSLNVLSSSSYFAWSRRSFLHEIITTCEAMKT